MVQLVVKIPEGLDLGQWTILEMQGDLETKSQAASLNGKFVGDLHFTKKKEPVLIIGHHILYGKVATLERPFIAVTKCHSQLHSDISKTTGLSQPMDTENSHETQQTEFLVKACIKKKIVFKTRPKPIIANVPKKL